MKRIIKGDPKVLEPGKKDKLGFLFQEEPAFREFIEEILGDLSKQQRSIYLLLSDKGEMSTSHIAKLLEKKPASISKQLSRMRDEFFVEKTKDKYSVTIPLLGYQGELEQSTQNKIDFLRKLSEAELQKKILIPLLKKMGYKDIIDYHGGVLEKGKDLVFYEETPLNERIYN